MPNWISTFIYQANYEKYFLFDIDIPWISDGLRNNEKDREALSNLFKKKLNYYNKNWEIARGQGKMRIQNVLISIENVLDKAYK